jgi:hypothetical protein
VETAAEGEAMARLAFMTFGVLHEPRGHPGSKGFIDRIPATYAVAERCEGFLERSYLDPETGRHGWGDEVCPSFVSQDLQSHLAHTFSLWRDLESVYAFAYADRHAEALRLRREWFRDPAYPGYVAWWVAEDHTPSVAEATDRLELLHAGGPTPAAFNFKIPFDARGQPAPLDRDLVKAKIERNSLTR